MSIKINSLTELAAAMRAKQISELGQPKNRSGEEKTVPAKEGVRLHSETADQLYALARTQQAAGNLSGAGDSLRRALVLPDTPPERRRLFQERLTATERMGLDPELAALNAAIVQQFKSNAPISLLVRFRQRHHLDRPQRALYLPYVHATSSISVYRWKGDQQYGATWSRLIREAKKGDKPTLALFSLLLTEHWLTDPDCQTWRPLVDIVVPVPGSPQRVAERNIDLVGYLADHFGRMTGFPVHHELIRRSEGARSREIDAAALQSQYSTNSKHQAFVRGLNVLLLDDVITRGRTASICASRLQLLGAEKVFVLTLAQAESTIVEQRHIGERSSSRVQEIAPWLCLAETPGLGPVRTKALLKRFKTPKNIFEANIAQLTQVDDIGPKLASVIAARLPNAFESIAAERLQLADRLGARIITIDHVDYPAVLRSSSASVPVLYGLGSSPNILHNERTVAIVGTRRPNPEVVQIATKIADEVARNGWVIISGLAEGCDAIAHAAGVRAQTGTIALLGNGVDTIYPASNKTLRNQIMTNGWLLSEYGFGTRPNEDRLRRRNILTVGAARVVLVMQTSINGGTMIAARAAVQQSRPLLCLAPPSGNGDGFSGNEELLRTDKAKRLDPPRIVSQIEAMAKG
jgi:DNA processing protein